MDLILASTSPRRAALLEQLGLEFEVRRVAIDESRLQGEAVFDHVQRLALEKARSGNDGNTRNLPVLGADTIVCLDDEVFGKPGNREQAIEMLLRLSGREHQVLTAVAMVSSQQEAVLVSSSSVNMRVISPAEAEAYWATGEPSDKAGGYAIQGLGGIFVSYLQGSYSAVVGLPLLETVQLMRRFGITVLGQ